MTDPFNIKHCELYSLILAIAIFAVVIFAGSSVEELPRLSADNQACQMVLGRNLPLQQLVDKTSPIRIDKDAAVKSITLQMNAFSSKTGSSLSFRMMRIILLALILYFMCIRLFAHKLIFMNPFNYQMSRLLYIQKQDGV